MTKKHIKEVNSGWEREYVGRSSAQSLWGEVPIPVLEPAIRFLRDAKVSTLIDLGCGDGRNLEAFCREGFICAGVDISPTALEQAGKRLSAKELDAFFVTGSMTELPFGSNTVAAISCFDVFGQIIDSPAAVSEFRRVLVPGGLVLLNAFATDDGTFGEGILLSKNIFRYKDTIFRYFDRTDIDELFGASWDLLTVDKYEWNDPPHGDFRPFPHRHSSYFVVARKMTDQPEVI